MEIEVIFLGGFLMAWTKLCYERRGKVSGRSEIVWRMKWWVTVRFRARAGVQGPFCKYFCGGKGLVVIFENIGATLEKCRGIIEIVFILWRASSLNK